MVENCRGGLGYSAETQGRLGFKGLNHKYVAARENKLLFKVTTLCYVLK